VKRAAFQILLPVIAILLFLLVTKLAFAQAVPTIISHQGRLLNASNQPVTTQVIVVFAIYNAATGGTQVWTETQSVTPDNLGFYETFLGGVTALPSTLPNPSYLQIQVQSETLSPRLQFGSVPFAQKAGDLDCIDCKVGIGTLNPTTPLHVFGQSTFDGRLISTGNFEVQFNGTSPAFFKVFNDCCEKFSIKQDGEIRFGPFGNILIQPANTEIGIGTLDPHERLHIVGGNVAITSQGNGLILKAADGPNCYLLTVNNTGIVNTNLVTCP